MYPGPYWPRQHDMLGLCGSYCGHFNVTLSCVNAKVDRRIDDVLPLLPQQP